MIADFPNLGTRWSDFVRGIVYGDSGFLASNGKAYFVRDTSIGYVGSSSPLIYSFSSVGSSTSWLFQSCIHDDWVYMAVAGRTSSPALVVNLRAYNVVTGAVVTVLSASMALACTPYSTTSCLAFGDVAIDPVTKIGVCCVGVSFTGVYAYEAGPPGDESTYYADYYGTYYRLFTFTAGTRTTNPAYASNITTVSSSAAADRKTGHGAVGAYNGTGIVYDKIAAAMTFKTINTLATPSVGSTVRTGYSLAHPIIGPMMFMDSGSGQILRDQAGRTWDMTSLGESAWYQQVDIIGEDLTNWYVAIGGIDADSIVVVFATLAKAGTTITVLDTWDSLWGVGYYSRFTTNTYWNKMPFPESTYKFPIQPFQYLRVGGNTLMAPLNLPIAEIG